MSRERQGAVVNLDEAARARKASAVLADVDWAGERHPPDPQRARAQEFLAWLAERG